MSGEEWAAFGHGNVVFPLDDSDTDDTTLLELADPAMFAALAYFPAVLNLQLGAALQAYALLEGQHITSAVLTASNVEPVPALYADRTRFPFFCIHRKAEAQTSHTIALDKSVSEWEFAYVLPALMPDPQRRLTPILHAVSLVMRKAARMGYHPDYENGDEVLKNAGIMSARLVGVRYERYERLASAAANNAEQFFRAVVGTLEIIERDEPVDGAFGPYTGANVNIDQQSEDGTVVSDLVTATVELSPTISVVTPNSGTRLGSTAIAVTGTLFLPGPTPRLFIGGVECTSVVVVSATSLTAVTPAHEAYPTFMADVVLLRADGLTATLPAGFTFTAPPP